MNYSLTPQIGLFGVQEQMNTSTFHTSHYDPVFISSSHRPNLYSSRFKCPIKDDAKPNDHPRGGLDDCNAQKRSENTADIESNDERRVRSALSKLDPHILLQQLDSPSPPKWQSHLTTNQVLGRTRLPKWQTVLTDYPLQYHYLSSENGTENSRIGTTFTMSTMFLLND
jgi:hypothetical protein